MARIRTIKPEFWTSEQVVECSANARLLFIGVWTFADDNGIHPDKPAQLKMKVFPGDSFSAQDIESMLVELEKNGLIKRYSVAGDDYLMVTGWTKHQRIDQPSYKYPLPTGDVPPSPDRRRSDASNSKPSKSVRRTVKERSPSVQCGNGMDRNGNGKETNTANADLFDAFWKFYPKKQSKQEALKAWNKISPDEALANRIIQHVQERSVSDPQWIKDGGQYVPNGSTFLNQAKWEDEYQGNPGQQGIVPFPASRPRLPLLGRAG